MSKSRLLISFVLTLIFVCSLVPSTFASSYTNSSGAVVDGSSTTQTVTASGEPTVSQVTISINFRKDDDPCPAGGTGGTFNGEIVFSLQSPSGTNVSLVAANQYSGNTDGGAVTVTFDDSAARTVSGTPTTGTFQPNGSLSAFNGENANGTWTLTMQDTAPQDPLCVFSWTLNLTSRTVAVAVVVGEIDESPQQIFFDGRINDFDTGNSVVLYGEPDNEDNWRLEIYNADQSGLLLVIPAEVIATIPECPEENTLIFMNEETGVSLWRLPERTVTIEGVRICPFQLNAPATENGKTYIIIFDTLYPSTYYESTDEWIGR